MLFLVARYFDTESFTCICQYNKYEEIVIMLLSEGIELTRGTRKIIQESIDSVDAPHKGDRFKLCETFCKIVEERYTGGAMNYQLERMGNSYPLSLLTQNDWTLQDAIESDLIVYLDEAWFFDKEITIIDNDYYYTDTKLNHVQVPDDVKLKIDDKIKWLEPLLFGDKSTSLDDLTKVINFSKGQVKNKGLHIAKKPSIKIPLKTTKPILDAIDKFLYDETGEYVI